MMKRLVHLINILCDELLAIGNLVKYVENKHVETFDQQQKKYLYLFMKLLLQLYHRNWKCHKT